MNLCYLLLFIDILLKTVLLLAAMLLQNAMLLSDTILVPAMLLLESLPLGDFCASWYLSIGPAAKLFSAVMLC
jgi:hypothetical protein